ncbi:hypothetical protein K402DRAFT_455924 [Aulographum hederae CBS 113979]|uniref:Uncharacterized protein n=1 Tax=Aulographum hederae CBS 113979 TaxID=1176131 RepID=A0A6G1GUI5_9PEZI|nr:hypothetical protein K402DRAFT_455924 [Aulographum hederae CBS 113979]
MDPTLDIPRVLRCIFHLVIASFKIFLLFRTDRCISPQRSLVAIIGEQYHPDRNVDLTAASLQSLSEQNEASRQPVHPELPNAAVSSHTQRRKDTANTSAESDPLSGASTTDPLTWEKAVRKGNDLTNLMKASRGEASSLLGYDSESSAQDPLEFHTYLTSNGWIRHIVNMIKLDGITSSLTAAFTSLGFNQLLLAGGGENTYVVHKQSVPGASFSATDGNYMSVYNPLDKVVASISLRSPKFQALQSPGMVPPPLNTYSDVTFLEWQRNVDEANKRNRGNEEWVERGVGDLEWVFHNMVVNRNSCRMVKEMMGMDGSPMTRIVEWGDAVDIGADTEWGKGLLGLPNSYGAAWMLIQHKERMGLRWISTIKVFAGNPGAVGMNPISDASSKPMMFALKIESV